MAHLMEGNDVQWGLTMGWHKLTKLAAKILGFGFDVKRVPILHPVTKEITGFDFIMGSDDGKIVGVPVAASYQFASFERFWELVDNARIGAGKNAKVVSLGTFGGRAKRYASIKLGEEFENYKVGGRQVETLLNLHDAIDKTGQTTAKGAQTVIVCANTNAMSLAEKGSDFKCSIRHSKNHLSQIDNLEKVIDRYRGMSALYRKFYEEANAATISQPTARQVFAGFIGEGEAIQTRSMNQVNRLTELFQTGKGNNGRTVLDAAMAVTDYYTHESSGGENPWRQVSSSEIGSGARLKTDFIDRIRTEGFTVNREGIEILAAAGRKTLTAS